MYNKCIDTERHIEWAIHLHTIFYLFYEQNTTTQCKATFGKPCIYRGGQRGQLCSHGAIMKTDFNERSMISGITCHTGCLARLNL